MLYVGSAGKCCCLLMFVDCGVLSLFAFAFDCRCSLCVVCCVVLAIAACCVPFVYCAVGSCVPLLVEVIAVGASCCLLFGDY